MSETPVASHASSARALLAKLQRAGAELWVEADSLRFRAPAGVVDEASRQAIAEHRDAIIAALSQAEAAPRVVEPAGGIRRLAAGREPPLSFAQQRLWFLDQLDPGSPQYNIGSALRIKEAVDLSALTRAAEALFARHAAFRTRIYAENGAPRLEITPHAKTSLDIVDLSPNPPSDVEAAARTFGREALQTSFDLAEGRLALLRVVRFAPKDHLLLFVVHHIVADGWSLDIVWRDMQELYAAAALGREARLPALGLQYADFAAWEQDRAAGQGFGADVAFWKEALAGAPVLLELPTDRARPLVGSNRGHRYSGQLDGRLIARLRDMARGEGATLFMALLAVWQTLLGRLSGQDEVVIGTPVATRDDEALEGVVGCFINNVALRGDIGGAPPFNTLLQRTRQATLDAFRHRALPFEMVVEAVNPPRTASYAPIFQTLFTLMNFQSIAASGDVRSTPIDGDTGTARFDLSLELSKAPDGGHADDMLAAYEYDTDLFDEATIARMHRRFVRLLQAACDDPTASLAEVSLLSPEEARVLAEDWNDTAHAFDRSLLIHQRIAQAAQRTPDAVAVRFDGEALSYGAFEARAGGLARRLVARGVAPGARVAVCLHRGLDLPTALAAVLKAGSAYVPLDPEHPAERIGLVLEDAGVACVVTTGNLAGLFGGTPLLLLDEEAAFTEAEAAQQPDVGVGPEDLAYLIYTSGSTGRPKGVEVTHANLAAFIEAMGLEPGFSPGDALLAVTTPAFDIAGLEMWLPLSMGGEVVIAAEMDAMDGEALASLIAAHDIGFLQATPTTWRLLLEADWAGKPGMKALCGGEALPLDLAEALLGRVGALWNVYGPTETTIWSTIHRVTQADLAAGRIPIGRPIANTAVYVLEPSGVVAPVGAPGELVIAGQGVARGYRNLPELTAERFVEIAPFDRPQRAYRTGDRARWRSDGALEYLGRADKQVKIRGFRIELGEVEAALASHPAVRQACVAPSQGGGAPTLVAYLVFEHGEEPTTSELRRYLRARLPDYMTPALFVGIDAVPLSPSGKVDRQRLPDPFRTGRRAHNADEPLAPGLEQTLAEIWREMLDTQWVGPGDNFFELGGHSLLSMRVAAAFGRRTGLRMDPRALFFQSLREVAAGLEQQAAEERR